MSTEGESLEFSSDQISSVQSISVQTSSVNEVQRQSFQTKHSVRSQEKPIQISQLGEEFEAEHLS